VKVGENYKKRIRQSCFFSRKWLKKPSKWDEFGTNF